MPKLYSFIELDIQLFSYSDLDKDNLLDKIEDKLDLKGTNPKISGIKLPHEENYSRITAYTSESPKALKRINEAMRYGTVRVKVKYEPFHES